MSMTDDIKQQSKPSTAVEQMLGSSTLTVCRRCGSTATYRGSPDKVNAAAKEFYDLHERCYQRSKEK